MYVYRINVIRYVYNICGITHPKRVERTWSKLVTHAYEYDDTYVCNEAIRKPEPWVFSSKVNLK